MSTNIKYGLWALAMSFSLVMLGRSTVLADVKFNEVNGYHCTPITTHTSLESAKAQVRVYQAKVRG